MYVKVRNRKAVERLSQEAFTEKLYITVGKNLLLKQVSTVATTYTYLASQELLELGSS